jgi:hypothetical protein
LPGVAQAGPHATGAWMKEFGAWYFDLARQSDGTFPHQGAPKMRGDSYSKWDCTGGYLLAYAMPLKKILLTGKRPSVAPQLDAAAAQELVFSGRGWTNKDRYSVYDKMNGDPLFECLASWSPIVRERAAIALGRRQGKAPVTALVTMLDSPALHARLGACQALAQLKGKAAPAVPALRKTLKADDLWLRIKAAEALAAIGEPAMSALPEMLEMLAKEPASDDPRNMQQRYLSFVLFEKRGLVGRSLEGVDRELLFKAVCAGLQNEDGRARGSFLSVYANLTHDEIKPLLPAILRAVVEPAPSGIMFADGIRMKGLHILAKHRVPEGIKACVEWTRTQNHWHSSDRTPELMKILLGYGADAKQAIPELKKIADSLDADQQNRMPMLFPKQSKVIRETIRETIPALEAL